MKWDLKENVPDMTGKTVIITGCTSGIGLEAADQLLERNATVVMACRDQKKMTQVAKELRSKHGMSTRDRVLEVQLDMSDLGSVRAFPKSLEAAGVREGGVHALVLNAGVINQHLKRSVQGVEMTFATNVLGHWLLASLLLPWIRDVESSRIVTVSSQVHFLRWALDTDGISAGTMSEDELKRAARCYSPRLAYMQSKMAAHWFTAELNRRLSKAAAKTVAVVAHPGYAETPMTASASPKLSEWFSARVVQFVTGPFRQTAAQGAWPLTFAVSDPVISRHFHYGPGALGGVWGTPVRNSPASPFAQSKEQELRLWQFCGELCGTTFSI